MRWAVRIVAIPWSERIERGIDQPFAAFYLHGRIQAAQGLHRVSGVGIGEDNGVSRPEAVQIAAALHQSLRRLAVPRPFLCDCLVEAHQRSTAAVTKKNHLRDSGLAAREIHRRLYVER